MMTEERGNLLMRLLRRDPSLWPVSGNEPSVERLGWLEAVSFMESHVEELQHWATSLLKEQRFHKVILLGMGGASLAAEVFYSVFGGNADYPEFTVLDTTSPAHLLGFEADLAHTLFIVSSKSGTTIETADLHTWYFSQVRQISDNPGSQFIAITDPGSSLQKIARLDNFRQIFLNPPDIGGRYSALSYFGLVPAALFGVDLDRLLEHTKKFVHSSLNSDSTSVLDLAQAMAESTRRGHGMLVLDIDPALSSMFSWIEQLVAESTGKAGLGILPVKKSLIIRPDLSCGCTLVAVTLGLNRAAMLDGDKHKQQLTLCLNDKYDLGGEFTRWQMATALAASLIGVNAFDQPDVENAKAETCRLIEQGSVSKLPKQVQTEKLNLYLPLYSTHHTSTDTVTQILDCFYFQTKRSSYLALLVYLPMWQSIELQLNNLAQILKFKFGAVTIGYGPRYLHSTGQLHKGGPKDGCFLQIIEENIPDLKIPNRKYGFNQLHQAQADGDFFVLAKQQKPIMRVELKGDRQLALDNLAAIFS